MNSIILYLAIFTEQNMLPCMSKALFGFDCPGCGLQRSVAFLLKGEFLEAFKMYPAIYGMMLLFSFLIYDHFFKAKYSNKITMFLMILTVAMILINYIIKFI